MEWFIGILVFVVLAKKGLAKQNKKIELKDSLATVCANVAVEACELLEVEIIDTSKSNGKRP